jgi:hypothetical protein
MTATAEKVRENRLRAAVQRQGFQLVKSRRRDPRARDYGAYMIVNPTTSTIEGGDLSRGGMSLDDVENWLARDEDGPATRAEAWCEHYADRLCDAGFDVRTAADRSAHGTTAKLVATKDVYQVSAAWHTGVKPARTRFEGVWCGKHPDMPNFQPRKAPSVGDLDQVITLDDLSQWKMIRGFNRGEQPGRVAS